MLGAIIGDIIGSRFEWDNIKTKEFELFTPESRFTDDSVMTLAVAQALLDCGGDYTNLEQAAINRMREFGQNYPDVGYGSMFHRWIFYRPEPYNSYGNGAAMRVSACGFVANSLDEARRLSYLVTKPTHNHADGINGAEATASCIFLARTGKTKEEIKNYIHANYYDLDFSINEIRSTYEFDVTCQNTVPQAIMCFVESASFEDAIRNAISLGGDSDTLGAIVGGIAEAYYGIPSGIKDKALEYLDNNLRTIIKAFYDKL